MKIGGRDFDFIHKTFLMGILNVTSDSFSDGGFYNDPEQALDRALQMEEEGSDLIDLGGESTRPGALPVPADEEQRRVLPVLKKLIGHVRCPISIDTRKASVASAALAEGAAFINDVSALSDPEMKNIVAQTSVPVVLMHMKGEPATMQKDVFYRDVVSEILSFLKQRIEVALAAGISHDKILIDPGIGFGKRTQDNLEILKKLDTFLSLRCPIVFGASRKRFIREFFGEENADIVKGSVTVATLAAQKGASILRVHDVKATREALQIANEIDFSKIPL